MSSSFQKGCKIILAGLFVAVLLGSGFFTAGLLTQRFALNNKPDPAATPPPTEIFQIGGRKETGPSANVTRKTFHCDRDHKVPDLPESLVDHVAMHIQALDGTLVCGGEGSDLENDSDYFGRKCFLLKDDSDMWMRFAHDLVEQRVNAEIRMSGSELQIIGGKTGDFQEPCHTSMEVLDLKDIKRGWFKRDIVGNPKYQCDIMSEEELVMIPCNL